MMLIQRIDYGFLFLSLILALAGLTLGVAMGVREDFTLMPVHAHLNLVGFVTLMLFGIAYRIGWAARDGWALVHFAIAGLGAVVLSAGIAISVLNHEHGVAIAGSLLTLVSMLLFLVNCVRALRAFDVKGHGAAKAAQWRY